MQMGIAIVCIINKHICMYFIYIYTWNMLNAK